MSDIRLLVVSTRSVFWNTRLNLIVDTAPMKEIGELFTPAVLETYKAQYPSEAGVKRLARFILKLADPGSPGELMLVNKLALLIVSRRWPTHKFKAYHLIYNYAGESAQVPAKSPFVAAWIREAGDAVGVIYSEHTRDKSNLIPRDRRREKPVPIINGPQMAAKPITPAMRKGLSAPQTVTADKMNSGKKTSLPEFNSVFNAVMKNNGPAAAATVLLTGKAAGLTVPQAAKARSKLAAEAKANGKKIADYITPEKVAAAKKRAEAWKAKAEVLTPAKLAAGKKLAEAWKAKKAKASAKKGKAAASPKKPASPTKKPASPAKKPASPAKKPASPAKKKAATRDNAWSVKALSDHLKSVYPHETLLEDYQEAGPGEVRRVVGAWIKDRHDVIMLNAEDLEQERLFIAARREADISRKTGSLLNRVLKVASKHLEAAGLGTLDFASPEAVKDMNTVSKYPTRGPGGQLNREAQAVYQAYSTMYRNKARRVANNPFTRLVLDVPQGRSRLVVNPTFVGPAF